ncbi:unnamed protein product, partial [Mesorhabditis belari]|uniref:Uncharacterized protein n=1 Tax=Mesorhabditis belari TaxID=2138241 RepID=A0AAF3J5G9_9BILA
MVEISYNLSGGSASIWIGVYCSILLVELHLGVLSLLLFLYETLFIAGVLILIYWRFHYSQPHPKKETNAKHKIINNLSAVDILYREEKREVIIEIDEERVLGDSEIANVESEEELEDELEDPFLAILNQLNEEDAGNESEPPKEIRCTQVGSVTNWTWSPSGRYGVWLGGMALEKDERLVIFDVFTKEIHEYDWGGVDFRDYIFSFYWLNDSTLIVMDYDALNRKMRRGTQYQNQCKGFEPQRSAQLDEHSQFHQRAIEIDHEKKEMKDLMSKSYDVPRILYDQSNWIPRDHPYISRYSISHVANNHPITIFGQEYICFPFLVKHRPIDLQIIKIHLQFIRHDFFVLNEFDGNISTMLESFIVGNKLYFFSFDNHLGDNDDYVPERFFWVNIEEVILNKVTDIRAPIPGICEFQPIRYTNRLPEWQMLHLPRFCQKGFEICLYKPDEEGNLVVINTKTGAAKMVQLNLETILPDDFSIFVSYSPFGDFWLFIVESFMKDPSRSRERQYSIKAYGRVKRLEFPKLLPLETMAKRALFTMEIPIELLREIWINRSAGYRISF